jgi:hypothetical protein
MSISVFRGLAQGSKPIDVFLENTESAKIMKQKLA